MAYRKNHTSKLARIKHKKRVQKRKSKYGGLAAFAYDSARGRKTKSAVAKLK